MYDSAKHRVEGTELAQYLKSNRRSMGSTTRQPAASTGGGSRMMQGSSMGGGAGGGGRSVGGGRAGSGGGGGGGRGGAPKWKLDSLSFRQAIRQAKMVSQAEMKAKATGIPLHKLLPPAGAMGGGYDAPDYNSHNYIPCPHCGRSFNEKAAERHIPKVNSFSCIYYL